MLMPPLPYATVGAITGCASATTPRICAAAMIRFGHAMMLRCQPRLRFTPADAAAATPLPAAMPYAYIRGCAITPRSFTPAFTPSRFAAMVYAATPPCRRHASLMPLYAIYAIALRHASRLACRQPLL